MSVVATVPELLGSAAATYGDHPAVIDGDVVIGYRDLEKGARQVARALLAGGVAPGDRVGVWCPNSWHFIVGFLGAQTIGASLVPLNTRYKGHEAHAILSRSRATALLVDDGFLGSDYLVQLTAAASDATSTGPADGGPDGIGLPHLRLVVDTGAETSTSRALSWSDFLARGDEVGDAGLLAARGSVRPDTTCDVLFTSGTTGDPKGVVSSHRQTVGVARQWASAAALTPEDRYAVVNPFFHSFGYKAGVLAALSAGATVLPVPVFDPVALMALVERHRVSVLPGPPTIFTTLIDHPRRAEFDLTSLRFATCGATAVAPRLFEDMVDVLGFDTVYQAYGLTECVLATMSRPGERLAHVRETTGPPVPGMEVRLGERDEICLRGPFVMQGYFEDPEATRATIDADGWLHTGDVGRIDEHGCVQIVDRLKDIVIVGGFNVSPVEVESVLARHPAVSEVAVVGVPDERLGAVCRAYVVPRPDRSAEPGELVAWLRERVANFKVPREVLVVADLPRNAAGKVVKTALAGSTPIS